MSSTTDDIDWSARPSQLVNIFGPGAIYDNLRDSVLVLGIDYWDPNNFDPITDPYLLAQIKKDVSYFDRLKSFASISSSDNSAFIPVQSFPTWGVCPECGMLQRRNGHGALHEFECRSHECEQESKRHDTRPPTTNPVRFLAVCERGHIDDFPFYEWAHKGNPVNCSKSDAELFLEDREATSSSLDSKFVVCRNCKRENDLGMALTKTGIEYTTQQKKCRGKSPWLKFRKHGSCGLSAMGILKGASNLYFPYTRSAITIPPFSDELSQKIIREYSNLEKFSKKSDEFFREIIETMFDTVSNDNPDGKYTAQQVIDKFNLHKSARTRKDLPDIFELEFRELNSGSPSDQKEFKTEVVDVPSRFTNDIDKIVKIKKMRQIVTITGFTRLNPVDPSSQNFSLTPISSDPPEWLPAGENRGEGIFVSFNTKDLKIWEEQPEIVDRSRRILGIESGPPEMKTAFGKIVNARYIFLHSLSHLLIRSLSDLAGYSSSSLQERIYSSHNIAGILIYTSSASSDGSLGGLVEQGDSDNFYQILQKALTKSKSCSSDPLCSFEKPEQKQVHHGSACHSCLFLPEPACEAMNEFLDRSMVHSTLERRTGFFLRD